MQRVRAPFAVLWELLGEPDTTAGADKSSTTFLARFEGDELTVSDFHKPEWGDVPQCRTDARYVWQVDGPEASIEAFCRWLSGEVQRRVSSSSRSLDPASRQRLNQLIGQGVPHADAMKQVQLTAVAVDDYAWPPRE